MGYRLFIAEKPKMGRIIASALARLDGKNHQPEKNDHIVGNGWVVGWLAGHAYSLYDTADYKPEWNVSWQNMPLPIIPEEFKFKPIEGFIERPRAALIQLLQKADSVVISTDAGQEGQIIAEIFLQENNWQGPTLRLWTSATEIEEMKRALTHLESNSLIKYQGNKRSGLARLRADWLIGINFTIAYTRLAEKAGYRFIASAGRVQSTLLSICVDHDDMVNRFSSSRYFDMEVVFETPAGEHLVASLEIPPHLLHDGKRCIDEEALRLIKNDLTNQLGTVTSISESRNNYAPPTPFNLTTLCIFMNHEAGISSGEVVSKYQAMYEVGWLTYTRTEDKYYEEAQLKKIPQIFNMLKEIDSQFSMLVVSADLTLTPSCFDSSRIEEHPANSPTTSKPNWEKLDSASKQIYSAVAKQMIAQFYPEHINTVVTTGIRIGSHLFQTKSKTIIQEGWTKVIPHKDPAGEELSFNPIVQKGDSLRLLSAEIHAKKTRAPTRMTEAKLLSIMEDASAYLTSEQTKQRFKQKAALGTAATRHAHVETLVDKRKYLGREKGNVLRPTKTGRQVRALLPPELTSPDLTAIWEMTFNQIRSGNQDSEAFIEKLKAWIASQINKTTSLKLAPNPLAHFCPECSTVMIRRTNQEKTASYWKCINSECKESVDDDGGKPVEALTGHGTLCSKCGGKFKTRVKKRKLENIKTDRGNKDRRYLMCPNKHFDYPKRGV